MKKQGTYETAKVIIQAVADTTDYASFIGACEGVIKRINKKKRRLEEIHSFLLEIRPVSAVSNQAVEELEELINEFETCSYPWSEGGRNFRVSRWVRDFTRWKIGGKHHLDIIKKLFSGDSK